MLTDQQIDEFLEMVANSPTSARDMVRGLFAAHEAKAAPAVPQGWVKASDRMPLDGYSDGLREIADELDAVQKDLAGIELQADGNANFYWLMRDGKWIAKIQMNGEMLVDKQVALLEAMLSAGTQIAHCPKCFTCFEVGSGSTEQNPWRDAVIEQLESWHICVPAIHDNSPRLAIKALVNIETKAALDPAVSSEAAALVAGQHNNAPAVPQGDPTEEMLVAGLKECEPLGELIDWREGFGRIEMRAVWEAMLAATPAPAPAQDPAPTWSLREALQKAKDALSLALSDVDWRKDSPTQPVIHKAYNCARQALALPTAEQVDDINVAESFTSVTKTAAPAQEVASAFTTALDIRLAQGWNLTGNAIPVLYTDTINDYQVRRDDVWLCTTDALKTKQDVGLTASQFDLICQAIVALDTGTITMEGNYMLDSDDCIAVVRVMQALFDIKALRAKGHVCK